MSTGRQFTEKYLDVMFSSLRDATLEEVRAELEHCRNINRKPVRVPKSFRDNYAATLFEASNGYSMQVFQTVPFYDSDTVVLYIHGGACIYQPVFFHWRFVHDLSLRTHYPVVMPVYPKYPEYHCVDDITVLLDFYERWILPLNYRHVVLMGDSFGGNVAMTLTQEIAKKGWPTVSALVLISPCVDNTFSRRDAMVALQPLDRMIKLERIENIMGGWKGELPPAHPWVSPVFGDLKTFPEHTLLIYGSDEILKVDAELLVEKMHEIDKPICSLEYQGMFHTFPLFPIKEGFDALKKIVKGVRCDKP